MAKGSATMPSTAMVGTAGYPPRFFTAPYMPNVKARTRAIQGKLP